MHKSYMRTFQCLVCVCVAPQPRNHVQGIPELASAMATDGTTPHGKNLKDHLQTANNLFNDL